MFDGLKRFINFILHGEEPLTYYTCRNCFFVYADTYEDVTARGMMCPDCYEKMRNLYKPKRSDVNETNITEGTERENQDSQTQG